MHPVGTLVQLDHKSLVVVLLDGRLIGYVQATKAAALATKLRELKVLGKDNVSAKVLEGKGQCRSGEGAVF